MRVSETRVQLDGLLQGAESAGEIARVRQDCADRDVGIGERRIELERLVRRESCCRDCFGGLRYPPNCAEHVAIGDRCPRQRGGRVELQRATRVTQANLQCLRRSGE